jgi:hypothetical protein
MGPSVRVPAQPRRPPPQPVLHVMEYQIASEKRRNPWTKPAVADHFAPDGLFELHVAVIRLRGWVGRGLARRRFGNERSAWNESGGQRS